MGKYFLDSFAIIEYLEGSKLGEEVKKIMDDEHNEVFISVISIAEILSKILRGKGDFAKSKKILFSLGKVIDINPEVANLSAELHAKIKNKVKDFGLADAIILASSKVYDAKLITGDKHFKDINGVIFLK